MPTSGYMHHPELRVRESGTGSLAGNTSALDKAGRIAQKELLLRLLASGVPLVECSKQMKTSAMTLTKWARDPGFLERLKELNELVWRDMDERLKATVQTTVARIQQASDEALDKVLELMHGADSEQVQLKAAQDILDRNPDTGKTHKVESKEMKVSIDAAFIQLAMTAEKEITIDGQ